MSHRKEKLEEHIKRIVADLIIRDIKDPRVGFVTVTGVELSNDKKSAKIGVSILGDNKERRKAFEGLKSASSYLQHRVGQVLTVRNTPKIIFFLDSSLSDGADMIHFLEGLDKGEESED